MRHREGPERQPIKTDDVALTQGSGLIIGMAFIGIQFSGWNTDWRFLFLGVSLLVAALVKSSSRTTRITPTPWAIAS